VTLAPGALPAVVAATGLAREAQIAAGPGVLAVACGLDAGRLAVALEQAVADGAGAIISFGIAGGLYYNYRATEPGGGVSGHGHEAGLALSVPIANRVTFGGTVKYFKLSGIDAFDGQVGGVTFDVGGTITLLPKVSIAVVGTNLRDLHNSNATQGIGYGLAVIPIPDLVLAADGFTSLTPDNQTGRKGTSVMVGGDLTLGGKFDIRLGGGYDAVTGNGYGAAGFSAVSEVGAIDVGVRQDLFLHENSRRATIVALSLRLFIPSQQPSLTPPGTL